MKIITVSPITFATGEVLPPEDLNRCFLYARDAVQDVGARRWSRGVLIYQCVEAVDTPYTQAMTAEELTWRFTSPVSCILERATLSGDLTCTADLQIVLTTAAGATPHGATVPYLSTGGAVATITADTTDINTDRVVLAAGQEYKFAITGGGTFTLNRIDLMLHVAVDRWQASDLPQPNFQPTLFRDSTGANATTVNSDINALSTEANKFSSALGAFPSLYVKHGLVAATALASRTFTIPTQAAARAQMKLKRFYLYAVTAGATTISVTLNDQTGTPVASFGTAGTLSIAVPGGGYASVDSGALTIALDAGDPANTAKDFSLVFANSSATTGIKAYGLAWFSRG